jgi:hypothetical protein
MLVDAALSGKFHSLLFLALIAKPKDVPSGFEGH